MKFQIGDIVDIVDENIKGCIINGYYNGSDLYAVKIPDGMIIAIHEKRLKTTTCTAIELQKLYLEKLKKEKLEAEQRISQIREEIKRLKASIKLQTSRKGKVK